jgi:hypothetical protein
VNKILLGNVAQILDYNKFIEKLYVRFSSLSKYNVFVTENYRNSKNYYQIKNIPQAIIKISRIPKIFIKLKSYLMRNFLTKNTISNIIFLILKFIYNIPINNLSSKKINI